MKYAPTRTKRARQLLGGSSCHLSILLAAVAAVAVPPVRLPKRGPSSSHVERTVRLYRAGAHHILCAAPMVPQNTAADLVNLVNLVSGAVVPAAAPAAGR